MLMSITCKGWYRELSAEDDDFQQIQYSSGKLSGDAGDTFLH